MGWVQIKTVFRLLYEKLSWVRKTIGWIVGSNESNGVIDSCYDTGTVIGTAAQEVWLEQRMKRSQTASFLRMNRPNKKTVKREKLRSSLLRERELTFFKAGRQMTARERLFEYWDSSLWTSRRMHFICLRLILRLPCSGWHLWQYSKHKRRYQAVLCVALQYKRHNGTIVKCGSWQ